MAIALYSFKCDASGKVKIAHIFFGETEKSAQKLLEEHAAACPQFGPAYRADETIETPVEIEEIPDADETGVEEFLFDGDEDEEDEEDDG